MKLKFYFKLWNNRLTMVTIYDKTILILYKSQTFIKFIKKIQLYCCCFRDLSLLIRNRPKLQR